MRSLPSRTARAVGATALAASVALGLAACGGEPDEQLGTTLETLDEEGREDAGDVDPLEDDASEQDIELAPEDENEAAFYEPGEPVTVQGKIVEVLSPQAFVIGEGDQATLVTRPDPGGVTLLPGYTAQVTGTVGTFVLLEVEEELAVDLDDESFAVFQDGPYVAATDVNLLDED